MARRDRAPQRLPPLFTSSHLFPFGQGGTPFAFRSIAILSTKPAELSIFNVGPGWELSMPLTQGNPLGYDNERMTFKFTMLNGDEMVECQISGAAMDELAGGKGTLPTDREAQFLRLLEQIEHVASTIFDQRTVLRTAPLRIFWKDVRR